MSKHALVVAAISAISAASVALFLEGAPPPVVQDAHPKEVVGLWTRWPNASSDGDNVRFYFFHEKGIGLYRYGKIGLNTTHSFDWRVEGKELVLTFRKTGQVVRTPYEVATGKPRALVLVKDPKEPLVGAISYTYVPPPALGAFAPDLAATSSVASMSAHPSAGIGGRMWIDLVEHATGGRQFSMYQLKDTAIDGRGVGWHHIGDFDDWSTEALSFRFTPSTCKTDAHIDLAFNVRGDRYSTNVIAEKGALTLVEDPRSFWHVRRYKDGGKSFTFLR